MQENIKQYLDHELLNIFTILQLSLSEQTISSAEKQKMMSLIELASILVGYEDVFLQKKPKFFLQSVSLLNILEIIIATNEDKIQESAIKVKLPDQDMIFSADRYYISEALRYLLQYLLEKVSFLHFSFWQDRSLLQIDGGHDMRKKIEKKPLAEFLQRKDVYNQEMLLQLALHIFSLHGVQVEATTEKISLVFKSVAAQKK